MYVCIYCMFSQKKTNLLSRCRKVLSVAVPTETAQTLQAKNRDYMNKSARDLAVNSAEFLEVGEDKIPVDERFFHRLELSAVCLPST